MWLHLGLRQGTNSAGTGESALGTTEASDAAGFYILRSPGADDGGTAGAHAVGRRRRTGDGRGCSAGARKRPSDIDALI